MDFLRKLIRISTLGLVGSSPRNRARREQTKLVKAQRKALR